MPTNKDFKRLVRSRMGKTGEAYTAARAHLLTKKQQPPTRAPVPDYGKLAGISDTLVKEKTGCNWERWVKALDQVEAHTWPHRDIARYVHDKFKIASWWCQSVTVGYERIKGLRAIGQRRDGGFEVNKSRTFAVPLGRLYRAWSESRTRARWLPGVALTVRAAKRNKSMRVTWPDQTALVLDFASKSRDKSVVSLQHGNLADRAASAQIKAFWTERLAELGALLAPKAQ